MSVISMKQLLEAGVHFGHQTRRCGKAGETYFSGNDNDRHPQNVYGAKYFKKRSGRDRHGSVMTLILTVNSATTMKNLVRSL